VKVWICKEESTAKGKESAQEAETSGRRKRR